MNTAGTRRTLESLIRRHRRAVNHGDRLGAILLSKRIATTFWDLVDTAPEEDITTFLDYMAESHDPASVSGAQPA